MKHIALMFLAFFAFNLQINSQSTINITTSGEDYPTEKWVNITTGIDGGGSQIWGQGDGTYGNGQGLINEDIDLPPGTYFVNCYDRFSYGWDDTLISVTSYGVLLGNNNGDSPSDSNTNDSGSAWKDPAEELEASFQIVVTSPPSCLPPTDLALTNATAYSADLSWVVGDSETAWNIEYDIEGFTQGTGTTDSATTTTYSLTGLSSNTNYDFYIQADCGGSTSNWVGPFEFTTTAGFVDIPQGLSPNGDGFNDCLILDHLEASDNIVKAEIYNRYGIKVFELNDYTDQWCGQDASSGNLDSSDLLPVGTYFCVIQFNSGKEPISSWIYLNY